MNINLTDTEIGVLLALIRREARSLDHTSYQRESEFTPRLKKLARIHRKLMKARYGDM